MREISYPEALQSIVIDRAATSALFDLAPEVVEALETSGLIEFDNRGLAQVATLCRGVFTEACVIAAQAAAIADTARLMSIAASEKILAIVELLNEKVAPEVLNQVVGHFSEMAEIFAAAAPILKQPIGTQPPQPAEGPNG